MSASGLAFSRTANRVPGSLNGLLFSTAGTLSTKAIGVDVQAYNANTTLLGNTTTGTGSIVLASSPTLTTPTIASLIGNKIYPAADSTTAIQFNKANGTTSVATVDTTNGRVYLGSSSNTNLKHALQITGNSSSLLYGFILRDTVFQVPNYSGVWDSTTIDTNTVGTLSAVSSGAGGLHFGGFTGSGVNTTSPLLFSGICGGTAPTVVALAFRAGKWNGTTGVAAMAAGEIVAQFRNWTTNLITLLGSGNSGFGTVAPNARIEALSTTEQLRLSYDSTHYASFTVDVAGDLTVAPTGGDLIVSADLSLLAHNIITDTTTGMKIGTLGGASGQKIGFFNATPIVQPVLATGASRTVDEVITVLQNLGLVRQS